MMRTQFVLVWFTVHNSRKAPFCPYFFKCLSYNYILFLYSFYHKDKYYILASLSYWHCGHKENNAHGILEFMRSSV